MDSENQEQQNSLGSSVYDYEILDADTKTRISSSKRSEKTRIDLVSILRGALNCRGNLSDYLINSGMVHASITHLREFNPRLQIEVVRALTEIISRNPGYRQKLANSGAVRHLMELMRLPNRVVQLQCLYALNELIGDEQDFWQQAMALEMLPRLFSCIDFTAPIEVLRIVSWGIDYFSCTPCFPPIAVIRPLIAAVCNLVRQGDKYIQFQVFSALSNLSNAGPEYLRALRNPRLLSCLANLLEPDTSETSMAILKVLRCITTVHVPGRALCLSGDALCHLPELLRHPPEKMDRTNPIYLFLVRTTSEQQVQAVLDAGWYPNVIGHLTDRDSPAFKKAVRTVEVFASVGTKTQAFLFIRHGIIPRLCKLLEDPDPEILRMVLNSIKHVWETTGDERQLVRNQIESCLGFDCVEALRLHESRDVRALASAIAEQWTSSESEARKNRELYLQT